MVRVQPLLPSLVVALVLALVAVSCEQAPPEPEVEYLPIDALK